MKNIHSYPGCCLLGLNWNSITTFNGNLYFFTILNDTTGIISKINSYASNMVLLITDYLPVVSEGLPASNTTSTVSFSGSFPMSADSNVSTAISPLPTFIQDTPDANYFTIFFNLDVILALSSLPVTVKIEAPCTEVVSSFPYSYGSGSPPAWILNTISDQTSTQVYVVNDPLTAFGADNYVSWLNDIRGTYNSIQKS